MPLSFDFAAARLRSGRTEWGGACTTALRRNGMGGACNTAHRTNGSDTVSFSESTLAIPFAVLPERRAVS